MLEDLIPSKESESKFTLKCGNIKANTPDFHLKSLRRASSGCFKLNAQYICVRMDPADVFEDVHKSVKLLPLMERQPNQPCI